MLDKFESQWITVGNSATAKLTESEKRRKKIRKLMNNSESSPIKEFKKLQQYCLDNGLDDDARELINGYGSLSNGLKKNAMRIFSESCALKLNELL